MTLAELQDGGSAKIVRIQAGPALTRRIQSMGIREGKTITKVGSQIFKGPVAIRVERQEIALSLDLARKILVEPR
jgi:Fe2+ transport system protein FeoA